MRRSFLALFLMLTGVCPAPAASQGFPPGYYKHAKECVQVQQAVFGDHWDPVLLAQIEQESAWRPKVCSRYAACGLTQFTGPTRRAVEARYGLAGDLWKPRYACTLQAYLMRDLARDVAPRFRGFFSQWAATLRSYNGSPASFWCEWRKAGRPVDAFRMEPFSCRRADYHRENVAYPRRILFSLYPKYREAWGE